jgi:hypothetical protein
MTNRLTRRVRSGPAPTWDRVRLAALAVAGADLVAVASIAAFFTIGGPFGAVNDLANGAVGALSVLLARELARSERSRNPDLRLVWLAGVGGAISVAGTYLVVSRATGWYQAGLVSGVGNALIGGWLLGSSLRSVGVVDGDDAVATSRARTTRRLGIVAGGVMLLGLAGLPGVFQGVDDWESAAWYVNAAFLGWHGTYLLYPAWCLRLARDARGLPVEGAEPAE